MELAAMAKFRNAKLLLPILAATLVGSFSCFWAYLYLRRARTPDIHGRAAYGQLERWLIQPNQIIGQRYLSASVF